jgi:hypothetical protein
MTPHNYRANTAISTAKEWAERVKINMNKTKTMRINVKEERPV